MNMDTKDQAAKEEIIGLLSEDLREPMFPHQQVVATIGCPGSGKSTLSLSNDPAEWVTLTLDDFRTAMWPPHRRVYWDVRKSERGRSAQRVLRQTYMHSMKTTIMEGWNLFLADTHITPSAFVENIKLVQSSGKRISWRLFQTPKSTILERNKIRPEDHRLPDDVLEDLYEKMWDENAWWRSIPMHQIEIIEG